MAFVDGLSNGGSEPAGADTQRQRGQRRLGIITGASRGLGAAIALALAPDFDLLLGGRDREVLHRSAAQLPHARPWPTDLTDHTSLAAATVGIDRLHLLVHNAAVLEMAAVAETSAATWRKTLEVNVIAVAELTRLLLPALRAARGHVILINSTAVLHAGVNRATYTASKHALRGFADALRTEEAAHGIRVTSIYPGRMDTDMQRAVRTAEGRPYDAEDFLTPAAVATTVKSVVDTTPGAEIDDLTIYPTPVSVTASAVNLDNTEA